ncbi:Cytochrome P450 [Mycena sanguinolenta]|uniref:Cytochrome P450 n=1 Tax=Mycena sanguinolenta TaxID=230812 RepID=A0A8H6ZKY1_9AGAR|nr:Cytochrome P450 [Mycena sanguinolenta]
MLSADLPPWVFWTAVFTTAVCIARMYTTSRSKLPLPPGPRKLPVVGNLFNMTARPWEGCMELSRKYNSDIIHLSLAGTSVIVLSSFEATETLLEKRSSIYSDRPKSPMAGDLMGWDFLIAMMKYGDEWRIHRRLFNQEFNTVASRKFHGAERIAVHAFLRRLLDNPEGFLEHLETMAGEIMVSAAYGIDALSANGRYIALGKAATKSFTDALVPGRYFVEFIPILKYVPEWFPGARFKRKAREGRLLSQSLRDIPFTETKHKMASGSAQSCFTVNALRDLQSGRAYYQEDTVKNVAAMMYLGGADTTVSVLSTFILAMIANPGAQKKAQQEIDAVVGQGNLPDFEDEVAMPYVSALVKEVFRWKNPGPIGAPHVSTVDDEYRGYHLPAGSIVFGNIWAILHDEIEYPDPYAFKPERFLLNGKLNPAVKDPQCAFGFGRRICPGRHMAISSIWITIVSLLATFDISKELGEDGCPIEPSYEYEANVVFSPVPFKCTITPRSQEAVEVIQATSTDI